MAVSITREPYRGWNATYRLRNGALEARVLADVGPRVIELRVAGGPNLFYLRDGDVGGRGEPTWRFRGGWRLWIAPERRISTYALDNEPCAIGESDPGTLRVIGPVQSAASIQKTIAITLAADAPRVTVRSSVANVGTEPIVHALWTLAALRPGGRAFLPLDSGRLEDLDVVRRIVLWSYASIRDARYRIADRLIEIDHRVVAHGPAPQIIAPGRTSDESKIGVDSVAGWAAYLLERTLFVTSAAVELGSRIDGGATLEVYSSRELIELEHLSIVQTIAPGASAHLREDWWVFHDVMLPPPSDGTEAIEAALAPYLARAMAVSAA